MSLTPEQVHDVAMDAIRARLGIPFYSNVAKHLQDAISEGIVDPTYIIELVESTVASIVTVEEDKDVQADGYLAALEQERRA